jgi:hypothetical protein
MNVYPHHARGVLLGILGGIEGLGGWFLLHVQAINEVMQFLVFAGSLFTILLGLHKVLKKKHS